jgi:hypothetical protein
VFALRIATAVFVDRGQFLTATIERFHAPIPIRSITCA